MCRSTCPLIAGAAPKLIELSSIDVGDGVHDADRPGRPSNRIGYPIQTAQIADVEECLHLPPAGDTRELAP
jgi:hypothetical protein